jgi:autotransporter-associated beta strand protein
MYTKITLLQFALLVMGTTKVFSLVHDWDSGDSANSATKRTSTEAWDAQSNAYLNAKIVADLQEPKPLSKSGQGTLTLSGNNTYSGSVLISAGTLELSLDPYLLFEPIIMDGSTLQLFPTSGSIFGNGLPNELQPLLLQNSNQTGILFSGNSQAAVPEPSSFALIFGITALFYTTRRRRINS